MFGRMVQKELLNYLQDSRFVAVFALCVGLSVLSVFVGIQNYALEVREYHSVSETNQRALKAWLDEGNWEFTAKGYTWNRRPEVLSPLVYGLSGKLGQEVSIQVLKLPEFEGSFFETDPVHALFNVLDLGFTVKAILSLFVLLFTYDAVCGEKEAGTLRLYASFPVSRPMLALAKLVGALLAVTVPFVVAFLLVCSVLALSPDLELNADSWVRVAALMGIFVLYLGVFAAFGLWASALTHRRMVAFLGLLGLWTVWLFVVPNLAVRAAQGFAPDKSIYEMDKELSALRWDTVKGRQKEMTAYWDQLEDVNWDSLTTAQQQGYLDGYRKIAEKWDDMYVPRLGQFQTDRRNQMRKQHRLAQLFSMISPVGSMSYVSMDLCRTGFVQQERVEDALNAHMTYLTPYIRKKESTLGDRPTLTDFSPFVYRDIETVETCLSRNIFPVLNLILLGVVGFAGAYVAMLRYDVR